MNPVLSKIRIYPIKSLDPMDLEKVEIGNTCLIGDRNYGILGKDGRFVNGKRTGRVNQLVSVYDDNLEWVQFSERGENHPKKSFHLKKDIEAIETYLADFFEIPVHFLFNDQGRFMDIPDESSITVVAHETIHSLANEFEEDCNTMSLRFRSNLEIGNVPAFWEEYLARPDRVNGVKFKIGDVELIGMSLRARCNVPPRNPLTGETDKTFIKRMVNYREKTIPNWTRVLDYGSLYHLTINTYIPDNQNGKILKIGDPVEIMDLIPL